MSKGQQDGGNNKCSCLGGSLDKLLQPIILTILARKDCHGYAIIQELGKTDGAKVDKAGAYRTLKVMEERGLIAFRWETDAQDMRKKVYSINEEGYECLKNWTETLEQYQVKISNIVKDAKGAVKSQ